jgi:hypothetical protein
MTRKQKLVGVLLGLAGAILLGAILAIVYWAVIIRGGASDNIAGNSPAATQPDADPDPNSVEAHLAIISDDVQKAIDDMSRATIAGKGGFTEKSRDDLAKAAQILEDVRGVNLEHPENNQLPVPAFPEDLPAAPGGNANTAPRLREALTQIKAAHDELNQTPGGDINGLRDSINNILEKSAADLSSGINFAMGKGGADANNGAANTNNAVDNAATGTNNLTGTLNGATLQITIGPQNTMTVQTPGDPQTTGTLQIITTPDTQPAAGK